MFGTKILEEKDSKYNGHIRVLKTLGMGTYIQCDGLTQSGGIVEQIWKSTLKKIKSNDFNKILILGLGGGTAAGLIRKKYPNAKIIGVEIDPIMIELGKKYLRLDDFNIDIKIEDAKKSKIGGNDLVIIDTYLGDKFIEISKSGPAMAKLTVFNRLYYGDKKKEALEFGEKLKKIYEKVETFYPTANVMFFCS